MKKFTRKTLNFLLLITVLTLTLAGVAFSSSRHHH